MRGHFCKSLCALGLALTAAGCASGGPHPPTAAAPRVEAIPTADCQWIEATYSSSRGVVGTALLPVDPGSAAWIPINPDATEALIEISAIYIDDKNIEIRMRRDDLFEDRRDEILWYGPAVRGDSVAMSGVVTRAVRVPEPGPWPEHDYLYQTEIVGSINFTCAPERGPGQPPDWDSFAS